MLGLCGSIDSPKSVVVSHIHIYGGAEDKIFSKIVMA